MSNTVVFKPSATMKNIWFSNQSAQTLEYSSIIVPYSVKMGEQVRMYSSDDFSPIYQPPGMLRKNVNRHLNLILRPEI